MQFNHLTTENGLSQNSVLSIAQDKKGFIWLGTGYGLNRYDGRNFKIYGTFEKDILASTYIISLFCDRSQHLWVGTTTGLYKYDEPKDRFQKINIPASSSLGNNISSIYEDRLGNLWIGTWQGLFILNEKKYPEIQPFPVLKKFSDQNIRSIYQDRSGNMWIGTTTGLNKLYNINGKFKIETLHHIPNNPFALSEDFITDIVQDNDGNLWIGTQSHGINVLNAHTHTFTHHLPACHIRKILVTPKGQYWIGTQEGLYFFINGNWEIFKHNESEKNSLSQNSIYSLLQDRNGSLWIGSYYGGANIIYNYNTSFYNLLYNYKQFNDINNRVISGMAEDRANNVWIGTEDGGLNYLDQASGHFKRYQNNPKDTTSLGSDNVKVVYKDKEKNIWIGTHGGGLNLYDSTTGHFKRYLYNRNDYQTYFYEICALLDDNKGHLWIGTQNGLHIYPKNGKVLGLEELKLPNHMLTLNVKALYQDIAGNVWIGASSGLYVQYIGKRDFKKISSSPINCIMQDSNRMMWVGISHEGIAKISILQQKLIPEGNSLISDKNIVGILCDNSGNLWLSSNCGILKFNPSNKQILLYTPRDGITGRDFNSNAFLRMSNGILLFGGNNGITAFSPNKIAINTYRSPITLTGLKLLNEGVAIGDKSKILSQNITLVKQLRLKYNQNILTIGYALLSYIKPEKNRYEYQLDGFNQNWVETTSTEATFTNLPPGNYTFRVKGANNDGIWSLPIQLKITVLPPFWRSFWAYALYLLTIGGIAFVIIRFFFLREFLKKEENLHQSKINFFTNISHEIRTHLTLILAPLDRLMLEHPHDQSIQQQLQQTKSNANRLLKLVNELMDFRKAESANLPLQIGQYNVVSYLEELLTSFQELSFKKKIKASIIYDTPIIALYFDKDQMEKVFANLLINAYRFTPENGSIIIYIRETENSVIISVTDNGRGISSEYINLLFSNFFQVPDHDIQNTGYGIGLALSKKIIELHKGTIQVESRPYTATENGETRFTVTLNKGMEHFDQKDLVVSRGAIGATKTPILPIQHLEEKPIFTKQDKQSTILIVEDNTELRLVLRNTFEDKYHIVEAENGMHGLQIATDLIPDVIISDVMMPKMDGFDFCTAVKSDSKTSHIPIILLTAKNTQHDQINGLECGADLYLTKPFSSQVLMLSITNLLAIRLRIQSRFNKKFFLNAFPESEETITEENTGLQKIDLDFLHEMTKIVVENMASPGFGVNIIARKIGMSPPVLYKKLKAVAGISVNEFVKSIRLKKALEYLRSGRYMIFEVADLVGFKDSKYFSQEFKKQFGINPKEYEKKQTPK